MSPCTTGSRSLAFVCLFTLLWVVLMGALTPTNANAETDGVDMPSALTSRITLPSSLNGVRHIALGGAATDDGDELRFGWESASQGWLSTWSLKVWRSGSGEREQILSSVWPKARHAYEARIDLVPAAGALSFSLIDLTANTTIFSGVLPLPTSGTWSLREAAEVLSGQGGAPAFLYAETVEWPTDVALRGLPLALQGQTSTLSLVRVDQAGNRTALGATSVLSETVRATLPWPAQSVPGFLELFVESAEGERRSLGVRTWGTQAAEWDLDLEGLGAGEYRLVVEYRLADLCEELAVRQLTVYSGVTTVVVEELRVPSNFSLTDPGVSWRFHSDDAIVGRLRLDNAELLGGASVRLEVWPSDGFGRVSGERMQTLHLDVASDGYTVFSVPAAVETEGLQLRVEADAPFVRVDGPTQLNLARAPVRWEALKDITPPVVANLPGVRDVAHTVVFQSTPETGTFNHHAQIFYHDGLFYASWSNHPRDEDAPGQRILFALSTDGVTWTDAADLFPANDRVRGSGEDGLYMSAQQHGFERTWVALDSGVYAIGSVIEWESGSRRKVGELARRVEPDGSLGPIFWLNSPPPPPAEGFPTYPDATSDPSLRELVKAIVEKAGPISWNSYALRAADGHGIVELTSFQRPDGTGVLLGRDAENSRFMYAATRPVGQARWSPLVRVDIPDSPSLSYTGVLPDGRIYLIHNPGRARDPLVVSLSADGIVFDVAYNIRQGAPGLEFQGTWKTRGYQYPQSVVVDGNLWVIYSVGKEHIHISKVPLASLR